MGIITKLKTRIEQDRKMRRALPIAAAIMGARVLAQAQGHSHELSYGEIVQEAMILTEALEKQVYINGNN